ncbi:hypothetical protein KG892_04180 [Vermiphilus pyriformis]|nr:MAG: hypothetical protein KG892_04180 [Vermiphilus pyriformis]
MKHKILTLVTIILISSGICYAYPLNEEQITTIVDSIHVIKETLNDSLLYNNPTYQEYKESIENLDASLSDPAIISMYGRNYQIDEMLVESVEQDLYRLANAAKKVFAFHNSLIPDQQQRSAPTIELLEKIENLQSYLKMLKK